MNREYRQGLLSIMTKVVQLIAEAKEYSVEAAALDNETLLDATRQIAELRRVLMDLERKLSDPHR